MNLVLLNPLHKEDISNELHPSVFFESENYKILIYRLFDNTTNSLEVTSHSFVLDEDETIFSFNKTSSKLTQIENYTAFYKLLDKFVDNVMKKVEAKVVEVEELEENIYDDLSAIKNWFSIKKELVRMERILAQAIKANSSFIKNSKILKNDQSLYTGFEDIEEHLNRAFRSCGMSLSKLDGIYNLYTSLSNEKMNATVYTLTIISAIFLPLNLLVGFFGMNTEGLYLAGNPNGTYVVTGLLVVLFIAFFAYFRYKKNVL